MTVGQSPQATEHQSGTLVSLSLVAPAPRYVTRLCCWSCFSQRSYVDEVTSLLWLLLADICGFKSRERPSWCDDSAGAWTAEPWFSQLLSFHRINVASVWYTRRANIRFRAVCCTKRLFAPWGHQTNTVCLSSPLPLCYFHCNPPHPTASCSGFIWHVGQY